MLELLSLEYCQRHMNTNAIYTFYSLLYIAIARYSRQE